MIMELRVISFYKYTAIGQPTILRETIQTRCVEHGLQGRILVGQEGINGAVCGEINLVESFKEKLQQQFPGLTFREQSVKKQAFHKLTVKVRTEIVHFGKEVDLKNIGIALPPAQLQQWYEQQEDFVIVDARNDYEFNVGKFKSAITLPIKTFREFPAASRQLEPVKDKKIVLYCTGGIRCEKASAYLKQQGFSNVYQLQGGIINYVNQFPNQHWQGGLFVFDNRLVSEVGEACTVCLFCKTAAEKYYNCYNLDCDKLFIACRPCAGNNKNTCSEQCMNAPRQRKIQEMRIIIGTIENYYTQKNIALVKIKRELEKNKVVMVEGKTTVRFTQTIQELRDEQGNTIESAGEGQYVTFPVTQTVRKHDKLFLCS